MKKKMNKEEDNDRYQNQTWYIKFWRQRYYLLIPYCVITCYLYNIVKVSCEDRLSFIECWKIHIGLAQMKMKWYYTWEEVTERLNNITSGEDNDHASNISGNTKKL